MTETGAKRPIVVFVVVGEGFRCNCVYEVGIGCTILSVVDGNERVQDGISMHTDSKTQGARRKDQGSETHVYEQDSEKSGEKDINGFNPAQTLVLTLRSFASTHATLYI
jgi:hypothetical protein